jgi:hypothetical protein
MKDFTLIKSDDFEGKVVDIVDGDNTGWFYDVPFQHFGEQDTTILELDNSNDLSQYFTNSDDFLILELDDIIDCGVSTALLSKSSDFIDVKSFIFLCFIIIFPFIE